MVLMILSSTGAKAKVSSMAKLFGKYKFTATVEVTEAGKAFQEYFAAESEVIITKDAANIYDAQITGFAGAKGSEAMKVNAFSKEKQMFKVNSPSGNNYGVFGNGIYYSEADGKYPFGEELGALYFTISEDAQTITVPDFTLVGNCNFDNSTCDVLAKFTNVKLTLLESEKIDIADITGEWKVTAGSGTYDTKEGSPLPTSYTLALAQNGNATTYKATFTVEGIAPFTLDATFDGNKLEIPYDGNLVDEAKGYRLVSMYSGVSGNISFNYTSESSMTMGNSLVIGTISQKEVEGEKKDVIDYVQWWQNGSAKKQSDAPAFSWAGTYTAKTANYMDLTGGADVLPTEGETVITYYEAIDTYYITKLFGFDVGNMNQGGMKLTLSADNPKEAEVSLSSSPYGAIYIKSSDDMQTWYKLTDVNGQATSLKLTANEDGTLSLGEFFVTKGERGNENTLVCGYQSNTLSVAAEEPETPSWTGTYTITADVTAYDGNEYPATFEMVIDPETEYGQFITSFITADVKNANYGGIKIAPDTEDANKFTFASDKFVKTVEPGAIYWKMKDMNGSNSDLTCTRNEDGSYSISSFSLFILTYDNADEKCVALYENVKATKTSEVSVESAQAAPSIKIAINGGVITLSEKTSVLVTDMSGRTLFSGNTQTISGLQPGAVIIRTAAGAVKGLIK